MKVIIKRGIPGSGKSYHTDRLAETYLGLKRVSTDHFWIDENTGQYRFDPTRLTEAHGWCLRKFARIVSQPSDGMLVVDNTNTRLVELAPYYAFAEAHGCEVIIHNHYCDPEKAFARQLHNVPFRTLMRMHQTFLEETSLMPTWWKSEFFPSTGE